MAEEKLPKLNPKKAIAAIMIAALTVSNGTKRLEL
jgi:hypothetical protein